LDKTVITYSDNDDFKTEAYNSGTTGWTYTPVVYEPGHNDNLLESGEKYKITMNLDANFAPNSPPGPNEQIKIEIKPPEGAVLSIIKTMPPALAGSNYYTVY
jgi:flagellin FlaB